MLLSALAYGSCGAIAACITHGTVRPRSQFWGEIIWHGSRDLPAVALTFDDGPAPGGTEAILDILEDAKIPATFFVIGENVERHPGLLRRIHEAGHAIGNHTWHHSHHAWLGSRRYWEEEIRRTDEAIEKIIGVRPLFFRPPIGIKTCLTLSAARRLGHRAVNWSARGRDGVPTDVERIMRRLAGLRGGDIVVMHDGAPPNYPRDPSATIAALPKLLEELRRRELGGCDWMNC